MESLSKAVWISASKPQWWHFTLCLSQPPLGQLSLGQHRALLKDSQGKFSPPHLSVMARNADRKEEAGKRENEEKGEEGEHLCTLSWHSNVVDGLY